MVYEVFHDFLHANCTQWELCLVCQIRLSNLEEEEGIGILKVQSRTLQYISDSVHHENGENDRKCVRDSKACTLVSFHFRYPADLSCLFGKYRLPTLLSVDFSSRTHCLCPAPELKLGVLDVCDRL